MRSRPIVLCAVLVLSQLVSLAGFADRAATEKRGFNASGVFSADFPDSISYLLLLG